MVSWIICCNSRVCVCIQISRSSDLWKQIMCLTLSSGVLSKLSLPSRCHPDVIYLFSTLKSILQESSASCQRVALYECLFQNDRLSVMHLAQWLLLPACLNQHGDEHTGMHGVSICGNMVNSCFNVCKHKALIAYQQMFMYISAAHLYKVNWMS